MDCVAKDTMHYMRRYIKECGMSNKEWMFTAKTNKTR